MLKRVKRHRKLRANKRHKKEMRLNRWFDDLLFAHFHLEAFLERRKKEALSKPFEPGGVTNNNNEP